MDVMTPKRNEFHSFQLRWEQTLLKVDSKPGPSCAVLRLEVRLGALFLLVASKPALVLH